MCETVRICVKTRLIDAYEQYLAPAIVMSERVCPWMRWKTRELHEIVGRCCVVVVVFGAWCCVCVARFHLHAYSSGHKF